MAIEVGSNFSFQGKEFLDSRMSLPKTLEDLKNWDVLVPFGWETCIDGAWYSYRPDLEPDETTGYFKRRFIDEELVISGAYNNLDERLIKVEDKSSEVAHKQDVLVADQYTDLFSESNWIRDGIDWCHPGIMVSVIDDPDSEKNGIYVLKEEDYTEPDNWRKVGEEIIAVQETEPLQKTLIWVDSSNSYTPTTVNEDVAGMIRTLQKLESEVSELQYAFSHEISFGDFSNNVKTDLSGEDSLEPGTTESSSTQKTPLSDGTVTTTTTTILTKVSEDEEEGTVTTTTTTTIDSQNSGGSGITSIEVVTLKTDLENSETVLSREGSKIVTTVTQESDGSKTTKIITTLTAADGTQTISSTMTNVLTQEYTDAEGWDNTDTITSVYDQETSGWLRTITKYREKKTAESGDAVVISTHKEVTRPDGTKTVVETEQIRTTNSEDLTVTIETTETTIEYDATGMELSDTTVTSSDVEASESIISYTPNAKHLRIKMGTYKELMAQQTAGSPFLSGELLYCYDKNYMYIVSPVDNSLILINNGSGGGGSTDAVKADLTNVDQINFNTTLAGSSESTKYTVKVDRSGELVCYPMSQDTAETKPSTTDIVSGVASLGIASKALYLPKFYINSVYCGGLNSTKYSYNYCSHNFVELSNLTKSDINLSGLSLQYCESGSNWKVLPLEGTIKSGSTFLIRGAQCSVRDINTTIIDVPTYDMEWYDGSELIKFSNVTAKFLLIYGTDPCSVSAPYYTDSSGSTYCEWGYIDSVGLNISGSTSAATTVDAAEVAGYAQLSSNRILTKYYTLDPVKQATKAIGSRSNKKDWYYVDLSTVNQETGLNSVGIQVQNYQPKSSTEGKDIFYNKTHLSADTPEMVTVTFGINATDYGSGATRCFNWVSKGYYNEYLWYRRKSVGRTEMTEDWTQVESFKSETILDRPQKYQYEIYNRQRVVSTSGEAFTSHKYILDGLRAASGSPVVYEYKVGRPGHTSQIYTFTIRNYQDCSEFAFVQTSDQQGFNKDEYEAWRKTADAIKEWEELGNTESGYDEEYSQTTNPTVAGLDFTVNTGDMTQNGNRLNEWLDYYNAGTSLFDHFEQMNVIGNNDLCPQLYEGPEAMGDGEDASKINGVNFQFFYTYEIDPDNEPFAYDDNGTKYYIHSLYSFNYGSCHFLAVNSEITGSASGTVGLLYGGADVYKYIKEWAEADLEKRDQTVTPWTIAMCHEMPFTIITDSLIKNWKNNPSSYSRGGSHLNTVGSNPYWFSQLLENYGIPLCIGGHKHTYSCSRNIRENYKWTWTGSGIKSSSGTALLMNGETYESKNLYPWDLVRDGYIKSEDIKKYVKVESVNSMQPIVQLLSDENSTDFINTNNQDLCVLEQLGKNDYYTAPLYAMLQASGYKQTSNKELPAGDITIPWLRNYFPAKSSTANSGQKYPFYIKWSVTSQYIRGDVWKAGNVMTSGSFSINSQNTNKIQRVKGNGSSNDPILIKKS